MKYEISVNVGLNGTKRAIANYIFMTDSIRSPNSFRLLPRCFNVGNTESGVTCQLSSSFRLSSRTAAAAATRFCYWGSPSLCSRLPLTPLTRISSPTLAAHNPFSDGRSGRLFRQKGPQKVQGQQKIHHHRGGGEEAGGQRQETREAAEEGAAARGRGWGDAVSRE